MGFSTHGRQKSFWGPRALAVISCALALLAAQPVMAEGTARVTKPVLLREAGTFAAGDMLEAAPVRMAESNPSRARRETSILASARRLHILATVEIFQRLLMAELRGAGMGGERQMAQALCFAPVCLEILAPANRTPARFIPSLPPTQQVAQAYAIAHCLLAPPTM